MTWMFAALLALGVQDDAPKKATDDEAKAKIATFKKEIKAARSESDRAGAIAGLGSLQHPKVLDELKGLLKSPQADVVAAAAEQVGKYAKDKDAAEALVAAAGARRDSESAVRCLRQVATVGYRGVISKLTGFFRHKDVAVAKEAIDTAGQLRGKDAVDPLLALWKELDGIREEKESGGTGGLGGGLGGGVTGTNIVGGEQQKRKSELTPAVESAVNKISGEDLKSLKDANEWWRKARATFKDPE